MIIVTFMVDLLEFIIMKSKNDDNFWPSYADLMTSMFFIMLVLFVLSIGYLQSEKGKIEKEKKATEMQLKKINELEEFYKNIDTSYFEYNSVHKKHILKISVEFDTYSSDIKDIPNLTQKELIQAGNKIRNSIDSAYLKWGAKCLLIIEGQASKDYYRLNYELSYKRALSLVKLWSANKIYFNPKHCDVIISGSGQSGVLRVLPDNRYNFANQRFLIHIIPKPGILEK